MSWKRSHEVALPTWAVNVTAYKPPAGYLVWGTGTGLYPCRLLGPTGATIAEGNLGGDGYAPADVAGIEGGAVALRTRTVAGEGDDYTTYTELLTISDSGGSLVTGTALEVARIEVVSGVGTAFSYTDLPGDHCLPYSFHLAVYGPMVCVLGIWRRGATDEEEHVYIIPAIATYTSISAEPTFTRNLYDFGLTTDVGLPEIALSKGTGSGFTYAALNTATPKISVSIDGTVVPGPLMKPGDATGRVSVGPDFFVTGKTSIS